MKGKVVLLVGGVTCACLAVAAIAASEDEKVGGVRSSPANRSAVPVSATLTEDQLAAVTRFSEEHPQAGLYWTGSRITRVYGQPFGLGSSPEEVAENFVLDYAAIFGVDPDDLFPHGPLPDQPHTIPIMYDPQTGEYKFTLVYNSQYKDGIPVFQGELRLLLLNEPGNPLVLAASYLRDLGGFSPTVDVQVEQLQELGIQAAQALVPTLVNFTEPELVIWAGVDDMLVKPALAFTFIGDNYGSGAAQPEKWLFVIDAHTGEILHRQNLIIFTDVTGNVSGNATIGIGAEHCGSEWPTPMEYSRVNIGSTVAWGDQVGDFIIPNPGTSPVTVESRIWGLWFRVFNDAGLDALLSRTVTPPGPAIFNHNPLNVEQTRAEVNGYIHANVVRDFVLVYNPSYPGLQQSAFPVVVNETSGYCPCNAWYDYSSITFCLAGGGCPNTAWSTVVHHEYGHHLVNMAGSGQGEYGEGMGDVMGVLITDDPGTGYGFFGDCGVPLRTADNTCQYLASGCSTCGSAIHACGRLLSGCVWSTRNELAVTNPSNYMDILADLAINAMLLHTGSSITPQITIDYLTLDDDDGNIGNGTPHRTEICAGFGAHSMTCPPLLTGLIVSPTTDFVSEGPGGGPFVPGSMDYTLENLSTYPIDYSVTNSAAWLSLSNPSGTLAPSATVVVTLTINSNANSLSDGSYDDTVNFVNTTDHVGDTTRDVTLNVGIPTLIFEWNMDTDPGWSTGGLWAYGQPTGGGGQYGGPDPTSGYTGPNVYGYNLYGDYENYLPERHLTSNSFDCTGLANVTLKFWRWLGVEQPIYDHAYIRASNNGSTWTTVWENPAEVTDYSWIFQEIDISAVADNQPTVYLRWTMGTTDGGWRYCGWNIDDIQIVAIGGGPSCSDGVQNQGEQRIDCGGPCPPCDCLSDPECDDLLYCTGFETCDAYGHCQPGTPVNCDDGIGCTLDSCNESAQTCDNLPDPAICDDGEFCNGAEICDPQNDCQAGTDPCPGQECDEVNDLCFQICDYDGTCEEGEDCFNCPGDCIIGSSVVCGNGLCEAGNGEDCLSCPADCNGRQSGKPSLRFCCGDGDGQNPVDCNDPRCTDAGFDCTVLSGLPTCCGDGVCEGTEYSVNCEIDCGGCIPTHTKERGVRCRDGIDNDCDGLIDGADPDCGTGGI